ncbi:MAG: RNA-processing protein [Nanoarchaeota archaeon]|nr:RNA-processing protein [Nanoarchaeota archaeon]
MGNFEQVLKIPKERIAVLIGTKGETKKEIEEKTNTQLTITKEGEVTIKGDSFDTWITRQIVKAIGRGFSPEKALILLEEGTQFEIIELKNWAKTENSMRRLKGRVIGEKGKAKETIERLTETYISVYGKTICVIGETKRVMAAKRAIEMLLSGSKHSTVFSMLEKERKRWKKEELLGW